MPAPLTLLVAVLLASQGLAPLRKSDLVRLLSGSALSAQEIAKVVSRNCLTFEPTERDRQDFRRLGAEPRVLAAVDACARRRAAAAATPPRTAPVRTQPPSPPAPAPAPAPAPPAPRVSAEQSGFTAGAGQLGPAGVRLPRALVFEARDAAGAPVAGQEISFVGINARIDPTAVVSDAEGRVRVAVMLGGRTGVASVIAAAGVVEKQVAFNVTAGPAAQLGVACGAATLPGRFAMRSDTVISLRVTADDAYGNPAPLTGLRAAVADARVFRVLRISQDSVAGTVTLKPAQPGTTSLAVIGSGLRQYLTVAVLPRGAREAADCP